VVAYSKKWGEGVSEQLEVLSMRLYVIEHIRAKYACANCNTIKMAPKPKSPIPKALAGGSLLTEIILNKYQYHLPLYRQSKILESYNAIPLEIG
jgi:transposase